MHHCNERSYWQWTPPDSEGGGGVTIMRGATGNGHNRTLKVGWSNNNERSYWQWTPPDSEGGGGVTIMRGATGNGHNRTLKVGVE